MCEPGSSGLSRCLPSPRTFFLREAQPALTTKIYLLLIYGREPFFAVATYASMKPSFLNAGDSDHDLASALEAGPSALAPVRRQQAVVPGGSEQEDALHVSLGEGLRPGLPSVPAVFAMISNMLREAFGAMTANKMRTFLTMLGMVIGV